MGWPGGPWAPSPLTWWGDGPCRGQIGPGAGPGPALGRVPEGGPRAALLEVVGEGSSYGGEGHAGSPLNPGGAVEGPGRAVQSVRCHAPGSQGAPGLTSAETVLQGTCWGLPLGPDDPPSGPQLASPWPLAWHPLWGALGGQGRPLLTQAAQSPSRCPESACSLRVVCVFGGRASMECPLLVICGTLHSRGCQAGPLGVWGGGGVGSRSGRMCRRRQAPVPGLRVRWGPGPPPG